MDLTIADPKGLIRESYRIEGITLDECKSIFMDWALSLVVDADTPAALRLLLAHYGRPDHPMTGVLQAALETPPPATRKGGRGARLGYTRDRG
ncbi:hypothetical protein EOK75_13145 (plasmid) [Pseudorhodobacter turbinis]|uniref:Uncharacterized protein n=1 Tax=Pseudorhodobacter turbinis TaxID=2500533 RepID=A0A4P8EL29_9RHOB|nr:hypothetical protein [Pseudorhodobacter turbinis]QCO57970.1 hypothetical protein EOK75_13145 [Pseudorhodobacter turbinis]